MTIRKKAKLGGKRYAGKNDNNFTGFFLLKTEWVKEGQQRLKGGSFG